MKQFLARGIVKKLLGVILCLAIAGLSIGIGAKYATQPQSYKATIQSIDEKKATVMGVTTVAAATSTALAAIPGDATTPIANQIMDLSTYLMIVVCALVLEKSLLTVFGYLAFQIMIPVACVLFALAILTRRALLRSLSVKITIFALVLVAIIPFSLKISDMIYDANETMVATLSEESANLESEEKDENKNWWEKFVDGVKDGAAQAKENAKELVNRFIDVIAVFVIAYCAIPIIVFLVVIWALKLLFNVRVPMPSAKKVKNLHRKENEEEKGQEELS